MTQNDQPKPKSRRLARRYAMQALYQWQMTQLSIDDIIQQFMQQKGIERVDESFFSELVHGTIKNNLQIDSALQKVLDRDINSLSAVECAILRIAVFEFIFRLDVPYRVVINEAIELAKQYGANEAHKYINGVLNNVAKTLRTVEVTQHKG